MNRILRGAALLAVSLFAFAFAPLAVNAQTASSETVSIQINVTTPGGANVIGVLVAKRQCGATVQTAFTFDGMINGKPTTAAGTAVEAWSSDTSGKITDIKLTSWSSDVPQPTPMDLTIVQTAPGLVTVNGVPVAIDGDLKAPCGGRTTYSVTNAGQGATQISLLPKTGDGPSFGDPLVIVALLTIPGVGLVLLSHLLSMAARRSKARDLPISK